MRIHSLAFVSSALIIVPDEAIFLSLNLIATAEAAREQREKSVQNGHILFGDVEELYWCFVIMSCNTVHEPFLLVLALQTLKGH